MTASTIARALVSVYDKSGIARFARALVDELGVEVISTGGTAELLQREGVAVTSVESLTGCRPMLDGRVKTLHPAIHAAILADRDNPEHMRQLAESGIKPIDMVVVNLYPFEQTIARTGCTIEQAVEMIDIGGPCLLRAAAKNHRHVLTVCDPADYQRVIRWLADAESTLGAECRRTLAAKAFARTAAYDERVGDYLGAQPAIAPDNAAADATGGPFAGTKMWLLEKRVAARYGENPHQRAAVYDRVDDVGQSDAPRIAFDAPASLNNYLDAEAALQLCGDLARAAPPNSKRGLARPDGAIGLRPSPRLAGYACVLVKHNNPCGCGVADDPIESYRRAYLGDPNAAMGGVLACGFTVTHPVADAVMNSLSRWGKQAGAGAFFIEVWIAPSFEQDAVALIRTGRKWGQRVRLVRTPVASAVGTDALDLRSVSGGVLLQTRDDKGIESGGWNVVSRRRPTDREWGDLKLAWLCAKHARSNAVTLVRHGRLIGSGAGQTSRVVSCELAVHLARRNAHLSSGEGDTSHCVAASDGFFPFRDGPDVLLDAGVTAIIQPGGSKRDADTVAACDERGAACVLTGTRHFRH